MSILSELRDREHWSNSSINQFLNICGLQWAFDRVYKQEREFVSVALSFGSAFHRVAEWHYMKRKDGTVTKREEVRDLFAELWKRQVHDDGNVRFEDGESCDSMTEHGMDMAATLFDSADPEEEVISVGEAFAVPLIDRDGEVLDKPLVGELDLVVRKNGKATIIDWKSAAQRWSEDKVRRDIQPTCYLHAEHQLGGPAKDFRFDVVVKNKKPLLVQYHTTRTEDDVHRLVHKVKMVERMVKAEHFLPNESSFFCKGCCHRGACKAWHRKSRRLISIPVAKAA